MEKQAILLSLDEDTIELQDLVHSLGFKIEEKFVQHRNTPDPAFFIGKGKIEEIKKFVEETHLKYAFVNGKLRPSQWFNIEKYLGINVYDRIHLILEIFADRAHRKEAQLQVKLARLRYERPFVRELIHRAKAGEHPGFMAGGEYQVANYYEMIKKQMRELRRDLEKIGKEREIRRNQRREKGFYLVSIAGYTNAGKSSLLRTLTGENVLIEKRLFSTLSPVTKMVKRWDERMRILPVLLTDTVGFIQDLPHWLVEAFHSTLEEIELADVIILVVDASDDNRIMLNKLDVSLREIMQMNTHPQIIIALNKIDEVKKRKVEMKKKEIEQYINTKRCVPISSKTGENIQVLVDEIYRCIPEVDTLELTFPVEKREDVLLFLKKDVELVDFSYNGTSKIRIRCSPRMTDKIVGKYRKLIER
jgi:GTP-binding protein HflX